MYAALFPDTDDPAQVAYCLDLLTDAEREYTRTMPAEARQVLADYYAARSRGDVPDRTEAELPCLWLDAAARRCRWHAWRPDICREFEVGGKSCRAMRGVIAKPPAFRPSFAAR